MKNTRYLAAGFGVAGTFALLVTMMMNRAFGTMSASTAEGARLLSTASIVIDVAGLVLFGLAAGALLRRRKWIGAAICIMVMLGSAGFSMMSIISFVASEQKGLEYARKAEEERKASAEKAQREAQKEVRDTQTKMAEQQLKWLQNTVKEADGRRERKDMVDAAKKLITEIGQQQAATIPKVEVPKEEVKARPDSGTEMLANVTGIDYATVQLSRMLYLAALLLIIKSFSFPLCSYFGSAETSQVIDLEPVDPRKMLIDPPKALLAAPKMGTTALLTAQRVSFPQRPDPSSDAKRLLEAIDFAPSFYRGPEREKDSRDHVAWRFLAWVTAHSLGGEHNNEKMDALLEEFAAADHRPAWASRVVKAELQALGKGFATTKQASVARSDGGRDRATHWVIVPPTIPKLMSLLEKNKVIAGPKQPAAKEAGPSTVVPFSGAAGVAPDAAPAADKASQMDISSKAWLKRVASLANGLDWSAHDDPSLARAEKASWRERLIGTHKKQRNRMSRNRSAA